MDMKGRVTMEDVAADIGIWEADLRRAAARLNSIKYRIDIMASELENIARLLRADPRTAKFQFLGGIHVNPQPTLDDYFETDAEVTKYSRLLRGAGAGHIVDAVKKLMEKGE